jgi:hypothetical protein
MNRVGKSATILRRSALRTVRFLLRSNNKSFQEKSSLTRMISAIPTQKQTSKNAPISSLSVAPSFHINFTNSFNQSMSNPKMAKFIDTCKNISSAAGKSLSSKKLSDFSVSSVSVTFICSMGELALWAVLNLENGLVEFVIDDNNGL